MGECGNCGAAVTPEWKFCIYCGTPVVGARSEERPDIPSAIRPESAEYISLNADTMAFVYPEAEPDEPETNEPRPRRRLDIPLTIGIALGVVGAALVVYMIVVLSGGA